MAFTRFPHGLNIRLSAVKGSTAGNFTITGITTSDAIMSVIKVRYSTGGIVVNSVADLSSEFSVTAANTINNTSGTNSTNAVLLVMWADASRTAKS
jgi:hypothetical protein